VERPTLALQLNGLPGRGAWLTAGETLFDSAAIDVLAEQLRQLIRSRASVPREDARSGLGEGVHPTAFAWAVDRLGTGFVAGDALSVEAVKRDPLEQAIEKLLSGAGLAPPTVTELSASTRADKYAIGGALRALAKAGRAVKLTDELFVDAAAAADFKRRATDALLARGSLTTLELKDLAGASRKFAIPLCEWLDREHVTLRVGDKRTLRRGSLS
jgi:hypothetical protein